MTNSAQFASVTGPHVVTATFLDTTGLERLAPGSAFAVTAWADTTVLVLENGVGMATDMIAWE